MAMLLDGPPSTIEDLSARDSDLINVAGAEGIDLTAKLRLAAADLGTVVETMLKSAQSYGALQPYAPSLRHIAVTPQLKLWHTYATLRLVYQDLYFSRLNDRYKAKMALYREEEDRMLNDLRASGLGVVFDPLPPALPPNVVTTPTGDPGGSMYLAVAFVNQRGEEGLASVPIEADTPDGTAATITITALADNAVGWNLYAGTSPESLTRQNSQTLDPVGLAVLTPSRLSAGPKSCLGQQANVMYPIPRRILRG